MRPLKKLCADSTNPAKKLELWQTSRSINILRNHPNAAKGSWQRQEEKTDEEGNRNT